MTTCNPATSRCAPGDHRPRAGWTAGRGRPRARAGASAAPGGGDECGWRVGRHLPDTGNSQVYDVNSYALAAAARDAGAEVTRVGIVSSDPKELREVVESNLQPQRGRGDLRCRRRAAAENLRTVLSELGSMEVTRIAMHPGSVQGFRATRRGRVPTFVLPANPVSALVVFEVMVRPLIRLSLGKRQPMRRMIRARTIKPITSVADRSGFLRGSCCAIRTPVTIWSR